MIELLYLASQIQCGATGDFLNVQVDVYHNQELVKTLTVDESALLSVDSINDLTFDYQTVNNNTGCGLATPGELVLSADDDLPNVAGVYEQDSVQTLLDGLNDYEELFLVELGTTDTTDLAYDLQDVVIKVDNNPTTGNPEVPPTTTSYYPD